MNSFEYGFFDELVKLSAEDAEKKIYLSHPVNESLYARLRRRAAERDQNIKYVEDNSFYGRYRRRAGDRDKSETKSNGEARRPDWATPDED